jgi:hypothetical protein
MHWWFRVPFLTATHLVALFPEVARIVGLVTLEPEEGGQRLEGQELEVEVGASLAMHVVAAKPLFQGTCCWHCTTTGIGHFQVTGTSRFLCLNYLYLEDKLTKEVLGTFLFLEL